MKVISEELGDDDSPEAEVEEYLDRIEKLGLGEEAAEKLVKEVNRLAKMPSNSMFVLSFHGISTAPLSPILRKPPESLTTITMG